jgi:serine protease Do
MHVIFSNGDRAPARLLVAAAMLDLAIVKVEADHPLPALKWGDSDALQVGDPVVTIGNPLGLGMSVSAGIVSALNRNLHDTPFDSYIQTDAAINYGNSGGPLIDRNGDVVGVDTALYNPEASGGSIGIGFAIPSNIASFAVRFLLDPKHPKPGWIGVTLQDMSERLADAMGLRRATGAIISAVDPSGPAGHELRPADVLETIDGVQQGDSRAFMRAIVKTPVGTKVHLLGWREGKRLDTMVSVAAWPNYAPAQGTTPAEAARNMIEEAPDPGMRLAPITEAARKQYGLDPALTGALVSAVEEDCEARELGIVPGDVITNVQGQPVTSPDDVQHAIENAHEERRGYLAMLIQAKDSLRWVSLSITGGGP